MKVLVQFTGAQGTGKTTLVNLLNRAYKSEFIGETSRKLKQASIIPSLDIEATSQTQLLINQELSLQYSEFINNPSKELAFAERSPICCKAYSKLLIADNATTYMLEATDRFIKSIQMWGTNKGCALITVYVPPVIDFVEDNVRCASSRDQVDCMVREILKSYNIPYYELKGLSVEDRVVEITSLLYDTWAQILPSSL